MTAHMDNLSDKLQSQVFGNLTDLTDFQNCRLVSQKWKRNVVEACRNKFHVVYPLTDSTLYTLKEIKETKISFDIYAFTGKENKDAWATSGIEPLMRTTEWIQFTGTEVYISEIQKFLGLAKDSLKTLSFKCLQKDLTCPFREMQETFGALRKLSIGYYRSEGVNDNFNTFTNILEKWNLLDCRVKLPLLQSLNFDCFDCRAWDQNGSMNAISSEDLFHNYIAIAKLLVKYKQSLREVVIERVFGQCHILFMLVHPEWADMERGLEALNDLNLNRLKITTKLARNYNYGNLNYMSEGLNIEVLGRPKNLKNILYTNLMCPDDRWSVLIAILSSFNNADASYLTSIKMNLGLLRSRDRTMSVNLGGLKKCVNLKTLWLTFGLNNIAEVFVRNFELLPKGISTLRFVSSEKYSNEWKVILLHQDQVRWIIDNLRELKFLRTTLVIPEQINANENNGQRQGQDAGAGDDEIQLQLLEDINRLANINLDTFRDLTAMPKLKNVKVRMVKARSLAIAQRPGHFAHLRGGQEITLDDFREYTNLIEAAGHTLRLTIIDN